MHFILVTGPFGVYTPALGDSGRVKIRCFTFLQFSSCGFVSLSTAKYFSSAFSYSYHFSTCTARCFAFSATRVEQAWLGCIWDLDIKPFPARCGSSTSLLIRLVITEAVSCLDLLIFVCEPLASWSGLIHLLIEIQMHSLDTFFTMAGQESTSFAFLG